MTKPFSPRELAARVKTVLRRAAAGSAAALPAEPLAVAGVVIDPAARTVHRLAEGLASGDELKLTAREFDLLLFLAQHPRQVFSRDQLMQSVWGYTAALDSGTVTVHVRRLREKIESAPAAPVHLETVWGVGYRFTP